MVLLPLVDGLKDSNQCFCLKFSTSVSTGTVSTLQVVYCHLQGCPQLRGYNLLLEQSKAALFEIPQVLLSTGI